MENPFEAKVARAPPLSVDGVYATTGQGSLILGPSEPTVPMRVNKKTVSGAEWWRLRSTRREKESFPWERRKRELSVYCFKIAKFELAT